MSNIDMIIEERERDIGNFTVGRLLPFRKKRAVGPFVFIDHMGPVELSKDEDFDIGPHPHIGLSTLTYLFEGAIMHRDSIGSEVEILPGAVNWMTAGRGVTHSERTPERLRGQGKKLHGLQIWVALPKELEDCEPSFYHIEAGELPSWDMEGVQARLIAGNLYGKTSPVPVHSDMFFLELKSTDKAKISLGSELFGESALYILEGQVLSDGNTYDVRQILIAKDSSLCDFEIEADSTIYIFGGMPFPEERYIQWNFVSSDKSKLAKAVEDWKAHRFPKVPGDDGYVPYPDSKG
jgi:redox-sensitive bicupin YhaK (pirin superfamily)